MLLMPSPARCAYPLPNWARSTRGVSSREEPTEMLMSVGSTRGSVAIVLPHVVEQAARPALIGGPFRHMLIDRRADDLRHRLVVLVVLLLVAGGAIRLHVDIDVTDRDVAAAIATGAARRHDLGRVIGLGLLAVE